MSRSLFGVTAALMLLAPARAALADFHVVSPYEIDFGEIEIEHNGSDTVDPRAGLGGQQSYTLELGTGLTPWWHSEIELGFDNDPSVPQPTLLTQVVTENMFQLTEPGEDLIEYCRIRPDHAYPVVPVMPSSSFLTSFTTRMQ